MFDKAAETIAKPSSASFTSSIFSAENSIWLLLPPAAEIYLFIYSFLRFALTRCEPLPFSPPSIFQTTCEFLLCPPPLLKALPPCLQHICRVELHGGICRLMINMTLRAAAGSLLAAPTPGCPHFSLRAAPSLLSPICGCLLQPRCITALFIGTTVR